MSWLFSQALAASSVDISSDGEPCAQLNVMPTAQPFWRNDKTMEPSRLSRFGLTLRLLTADRGEELLTSYLAGFRVRTSLAPAGAMDSTESDQDSGFRWLGSFAKFDLATSTWRTRQCSLLGGLEEFSEIWPRYGSMRDGECIARQTSVPNTLENESGFWPTPTVCGNYNRKGASATSGDGLATAVKMYPTPQASDNRNRGTKSTPAIARRIEDGKQVMLSMVMDGPLNPTWVEWLMGWPLGLTDLKPLETAKFQEWRRQHGGC